MKRLQAIGLPWLGLLLASLHGCAGQAPAPATQGSAPVLPPGEYLLFEPTAAAQELLGKQVLFDERGGFRVAEYLAPGCRVEVVESPDEWHREFVDNVGDLVTAGGNVLGVVELSAEQTRVAYSTMDIHNSAVLTARLKGPCGGNVIRKVKVGSGSRRVYRARSAAGGANVTLPQVGIGAALEGQNFEKLDMDLSWSTRQAWGFELSDQTAEDGVQLEVTIEPTVVPHNGSYRVRVQTDEPATLVVIAQEDIERGGRSAVILPALAGGQIHRVATTAGQPLELPAAVATLRDPGLEQRDRLIVYALRNEAELEALDLRYGELSDDERAQQARQVMERLDALPPQTVARREVGYRIVPAQSAQE